MASNRDLGAQFDHQSRYTGESNPVLDANGADGINDTNYSNGGIGHEGVKLKKGPWTADEDAILIEYVVKHGEGNWNAVRKNTGLNRCGKSCRLRWANHLRPNLKKGAFSPEEEKLIVQLHAQFGNKWAKMASLLPGRTDNEIKNYWNTRIKRRQRQGLPLYSDEPQQQQRTLTPPTTPTGPTFQFHHHTQHHHFPLSPTIRSSLTSPTSLIAPTTPTTSTIQFHAQHHQYPPLSPQAQSHHNSSLTSPHPTTPTYNGHHPTSSYPTLSSFTFQRPPPTLSPTLRFKRFRNSSGSYSVPPSTTSSDVSLLDHHQPATPTTLHFEGFQFPTPNTPSSSIYKPQVDSDGVAASSTSVYPSKLKLPSNRFSQARQLEISFHDKVNHEINNGGLRDLLYDNQDSSKSILFNFKEDNSLLDAFRDLDDLSSLYCNWPNNSSSGNLSHLCQLNNYIYKIVD